MSAERQTNPDLSIQNTALEQQLNRRNLLRLGAAAVVASVLPKVPESNITRQLGSSAEDLTRPVEARETEGFKAGYHAEFRVIKRTNSKSPILLIIMRNPGDGANTTYFYKGNEFTGEGIEFMKVFTHPTTREKYDLGELKLKKYHFNSEDFGAYILNKNDISGGDKDMFTSITIRRAQKSKFDIVSACTISPFKPDCGYDLATKLEFEEGSFEGNRGFVVVGYPEGTPASATGTKKSMPVWVGITGRLLKPAELTIMGEYPVGSELVRFAGNRLDTKFKPQVVTQKINPTFMINKSGGYVIIKP